LRQAQKLSKRQSHFVCGWKLLNLQSSTESGSSLEWPGLFFFFIYLGPFETGRNRSTKFDRSKARRIFVFFLFFLFLLFQLPLDFLSLIFCQIGFFPRLFKHYSTCHINQLKPLQLQTQLQPLKFPFAEQDFVITSGSGVF